LPTKDYPRSNRPLTLAARSQPFQESVIREMTRLGDETGSVNLSQGLPDFEPPASVLAAAIAAIQSGENQYTFPFGSNTFREAISNKTSRYNHIQADPETEITVTCGVSEAIMAVILALTDPGDEVIILEPWYENYLPDCYMAGVKPRFVSLHEPDYTFDTQELRNAFNTHTRLILINTPHNPTGRAFSQGELNEIAKLCCEFGVIAVTDEIYEHVLYDGHTHISMGSLEGMDDRTVTISGLGKSYAVTGWRVGWTVAQPPITRLIRKVHDYLTICAPSPFQAAGSVALELPQEYYTNMRQQYLQRRKILLEALSTAGMAFRVPQGAYYVMAGFENVLWNRERYIKDAWSKDRAFAEFLAREIGVAVVPGSSFYFNATQGSTRVRFNFAKDRMTMQEAAKRLLQVKQA
jgi:aspartate/methionine/tyrosine aminotransferase